MRTGLLALALIAVLAGCAGGAEPAATTGPAPTPEATEALVASDDVGASEEPAASEEASAAVTMFKVGQPIDVKGEFISSDVRVTVSKVVFAKKYGAYSKPKSGNVYMAVKYTYEALEDGATYNPFDWQVFVDDTAADNFAFVMDGPTPALSSGTLPKGRKATGWVVYEIPKTGKVVLSYGANLFGGDAPTFEVVARSK